MNVHIRNATLADADVVVDYNRRLAAETEGLTLSLERLVPGVRQVLGDSTKGRYFIAEVDGVAVGQTMITLEWSDWRNGMFWWIQSVYVTGHHRSNGVFRALYQHVTEQARLAGAIGVRLYVDAENDIARSVYDRLGMAHTNYRIMEVPISQSGANH